MNEQRVTIARQHLVEMLDDAGQDLLRDGIALLPLYHALFRKLAETGFGGVGDFINSFQPVEGAVGTVDQFVESLQAKLE